MSGTTQAALATRIAARQSQIEREDPATFRHGLALIEWAELSAEAWVGLPSQAQVEQVFGFIESCRRQQPAGEPYAVLYDIAGLVPAAHIAGEARLPGQIEAVLEQAKALRSGIKPAAGSHATVARIEAGLHMTRFAILGDPLDLELALDACGTVLANEARARRADLFAALLIHAQALRARGVRTGNAEDIAHAMAAAKAGLGAAAASGYRLALLKELAVAGRHHARHAGNSLESMDEAIAACREVLAATPEGAAAQAELLDCLGNLLDSRFRMSGRAGDLDEAIALSQQALAAAACADPQAVAGYHANHGLSLLQAASSRRSPDLLARALQAAEAGLRLPGLPPDAACALQMQRAQALLMLHAATPSASMLDDAIDAASIAVSGLLQAEHDLPPDYRLGFGRRLTDGVRVLAGALVRRGSPQDLERAVVVGEAVKSVLLVRALLLRAAAAAAGVDPMQLHMERQLLGKIVSLDAMDLRRGRDARDAPQRLRRMRLRQQHWDELQAVWACMAQTGEAGAAHVAGRTSPERAVAGLLAGLPDGLLALSMVDTATASPDLTWQTTTCLLSFDPRTRRTTLLGQLPRPAVLAALDGFREEVLGDHDLPPAQESWWRPLAALLGGGPARSRPLVLSPAPGFEAMPWSLAFERLGWPDAADAWAGLAIVPTLAALHGRDGPAADDAMAHPFFAIEQEEALAMVVAAANAAEPAMVLGNPTGDLPYADYEARCVGRIVGAVPALRGEATSAVLRGGLFSARLLHLAAHVTVDEADPLDSRIHLADTTVLARELLRYVSKAQLVVLSACESGSGQALGGEVLGLVAALLRSGVDTVVASLWPVDDRATSHLMARFYEALRDGAAIPAALHLAMADTRRQDAWAGSWHWGGFQVFSRLPTAGMQLPIR